MVRRISCTQKKCKQTLFYFSFECMRTGKWYSNFCTSFGNKMPYQHWQTQPFIKSELKRLDLFEPRVCQVYCFRSLPLVQLVNVCEKYCCNSKTRLKNARWKCSSKREESVTASVFTNSGQVFLSSYIRSMISLFCYHIPFNPKYYRFCNPGEGKYICYFESKLKLNGFYLIYSPSSHSHDYLCSKHFILTVTADC